VQTLKSLSLIIVAAVLLLGAAWSTRAIASAARRRAGDAPVAAARPAQSVTPDADLLEARSIGDPDAPVTVLEASDFQCPYCRQFWLRTLPFIETEYINTGKVRYVFLNLPLGQIHPNAMAAHEFAMCAAQQEQFWPVHDLLFMYQPAWSALSDPGPYFRQLADSAGLDEGRLEQCIESGEVQQLIEQELRLNAQSGLRSTPSFVIEGGILPGYAPIELWRPILDSIWEAKANR